MKKNDFILIGIILLTAVCFFGFQYIKQDSMDSEVVITVDGDVQGTYDLYKEQTVDINGTNKLVIKDGKADMIHADCPDELCVNQKAISRDGESIICLPNKIVVSILGGQEKELDGVTN